MKKLLARPKDASIIYSFDSFEEYYEFCQKERVGSFTYFNYKKHCLIRVAPGGHIDETPWSKKAVIKLYTI